MNDKYWYFTKRDVARNIKGEELRTVHKTFFSLEVDVNPEGAVKHRLKVYLSKSYRGEPRLPRLPLWLRPSSSEAQMTTSSM